MASVIRGDDNFDSGDDFGPTLVRSTAFSAPNTYRYSYAHGQGSVPDLVWGELKVLTAQHGYAVGASIKFTNMLELDETDYVQQEEQRRPNQKLLLLSAEDFIR